MRRRRDRFRVGVPGAGAALAQPRARDLLAPDLALRARGFASAVTAGGQTGLSCQGQRLTSSLTFVKAQKLP